MPLPMFSLAVVPKLASTCGEGLMGTTWPQVLAYLGTTASLNIGEGMV